MIIRKKQEMTPKRRASKHTLDGEDYFILTAEAMLEVYPQVKDAMKKRKEKSFSIKTVINKIVAENLDDQENMNNIHYANRLIGAFRNWLFLTEPKLQQKNSNIFILLLLVNEQLETAIKIEKALLLARDEKATETTKYLNELGIIDLINADTQELYESIDTLRYYLAGVNTEIDILADEYKITRLHDLKQTEEQTPVADAIKNHNKLLKRLKEVIGCIENDTERETKQKIVEAHFQPLPLKVETDPTAIKRVKYYTANYFEMTLDGNIPKSVQDILQLRHQWNPKDLSYEEDDEEL